MRTLSAGLRVADLDASLAFYAALGFTMAYGGEEAEFTSFRVAGQHVNLTSESGGAPGGGLVRIIFYVDDVDAMHRHVLAQGLRPESSPRDAPWGERYFHVTDPDGHTLSFARPLGW